MREAVATNRHRPRPSVDYVPRLLTAADLAMLPSELPSGTFRYELDNGILLTVPLPDDSHAAVVSNLASAFHLQGVEPGSGKARSGVGVILWRNPDRVIGVDVAFIALASLPIQRSPEDYLETLPDLVVEVRNRNDTTAVIERRVDDFLTAGVRVVWVADPQERTVTEFRAGASLRVYLDGETLTIDDVILGFRLPVRDALRT